MPLSCRRIRRTFIPGAIGPVGAINWRRPCVPGPSAVSSFQPPPYPLPSPMTTHLGAGRPMETPPKDIVDALARMGLLRGAKPAGEPMVGGVSSDIWRIDLPGGPICVKRALPRLRVAADWQAPVERNLYEARWMQVASHAVPARRPRCWARTRRPARWRWPICRPSDIRSGKRGCATVWLIVAFAAARRRHARPDSRRNRRGSVAGADVSNRRDLL